MSSRKRAMRRENRSAVRRVASEAGVRRYDQPMHSIIRPKVSLEDARGQVRENLSAFNPKRNDDRSAEEIQRDLDQQLTGLIKHYRNAPTQLLRQHERVLTDIVERNVDERGHHSEIPAFQAARAEAAAALLQSIRGTLQERPPSREDGFGRTEGDAAGERLRRRVADRPEVRDIALGRMADKVVRPLDAPEPEPKGNSRTHDDRMRRLYWEARNRARNKELAGISDRNPQWVKDAIGEMSDLLVAPEKRRGPTGRMIKDPGSDPGKVAALIRPFVAKLADKQGIPEPEVYRALLAARGGLPAEHRKGLFAAAGVIPQKAEPGYLDPHEPTGMTMRPAPAKPKFREPKTLTRISDADLAAYRDQMKGFADSRSLPAATAIRARDAHRAAVAEIDRRKRGLKRR